MTEQQIIEWAREAGCPVRGHYDESGCTPAELTRFAALVAAPQAPAVQPSVEMEILAEVANLIELPFSKTEADIPAHLAELLEKPAVQQLTNDQIWELDWPADVGGFNDVEFIARQVEAAHGIGAPKD